MNLLTPHVFIPPDLNADSIRNVSHKAYTALLLEGETMGSYWKLNVLVEEVSDELRNELRQLVSDRFDLVINQMSHWKVDSTLSVLNQSEPYVPQRIPAEFFYVLQAGLEIAELTGGSYDPTIGKEVSLAGFGPSLELFGCDALLQAGDWSTLSLDAQNQTVSHQGMVHLDLSSIAKGYGIDLAGEALEKLGYTHYLLEIGGEMRGAGCKANGEPWWAEISSELEKVDSQESERILIAMSGVSLATSGVTVKKRVEDGVIKHHLMDTETRHSIASDLVAVSVLAKTCMEADAWATALYTLGIERGMMMANERGLAAVFIEQTIDGVSITMSDPCAAFLEG